MQPDSPFQLLETLGSCQVGKVWSAVDAQGRAMTVAVLDAAAATDQRWRDAFASTANALNSQEGGPSFLYADFSASTPWVTCAAGDGPGAEQIFVALGMDYRPTSSPAQVPATDPSTSGPPSAKLAIGEPTQAIPLPAGTSANGEQTSADAIEWPSEGLQPTSGAGRPVSTPPSSVSVPPPSVPDTPSPAVDAPRSPAVGPLPPTMDAPRSPAVGPLPPTMDASPPAVNPPPLVFPYETSYPPLATVEPERPRRTGLWVGVAVAVVVALGAGVGFLAWQSGGDPGATGSSPSPSVAKSSSPEPIALPTGMARNPGVEPPKPGSWPSEPQFSDADRVREENRPGFGFTFKVPETWACDARDRGPGYARHVCGIARPGVPEVGGEIIVRNCPKPCGEQVQAAYRRAEEAWGLQWTQAGNATFAETSRLNGQARYGLVVIGWWGSNPDEDVIDRQIVIRMTAVGAQVSEVRKVVNGIRATLSF